MPAYRLTVEHHSKLRSLEGLHWVGDSQEQHDGSFIVHCSMRAAEMIGQCGIDMEFIATRLSVPDGFYDLARKFGNWSVFDFCRKNPQGTPEQALAALSNTNANAHQADSRL